MEERKLKRQKPQKGWKNIIPAGLEVIGRYIPLRHRYVLTRNNNLRLRYVVSTAVLCLITGAGILSGTASPSRALHTQEVYADSGAYSSTEAENKLAVTQRRLDRNHGEYHDENTSADNDERFAAASVPAAPRYKEETVIIGKGDTLAGVLQKAGLGAGDSYRAVKAMEAHYDPRKIRIGQEVKVRFEPLQDRPDAYRFSRMEIAIDPIHSVRLDRTDQQDFAVAMLEKEVQPQIYAGKADIEVSLYGSAEKAGIPASVIAKTIHIYSWDVDFQRDIRKGDVLEVMYEQLETPEGVRVKSGDIIYARLNVNGQDIPVYRYEKASGDMDYYTANGVSIRKALMQTPIDGARLSSGFGLRRHPVLGYNKMHKGVDFAAARGTPIYAAGDGTVEKAGPWSSYGNYIRIRHNSSLKTAYAHLKGFAKGVSSGKRVKQGQVIGYVGTTGRSTGPHLHYEVLLNGKQVNPKTVDLPQGETLHGEQLAAFKAHIEKLDRQYATLTGRTKLASRATLHGGNLQ